MKIDIRFAFVLLLSAFFIPETGSAQIFIKNDHADEYYEEAVTLKNKKHTGEAIKLLEKALDRRKDFPDATALLGQLYVATKQYNKARPVVAKLMQQDAKNKDGYLFGFSIEMNTGNRIAAVKILNKALEQFPYDKQLWIKKMGTLSDGRSFFSANQAAQKALSLFPYDKMVRNTALYHYRQAGDFYYATGNMKLAEENFSKAMYLEPNNQQINEALVRVYAKENNLTDALSQVNKALTMYANSAILLYKKLDLLTQMRRYPEALETLAIIRKYNPKDQKAAKLEPGLRMEAGKYYSGTDPYMVYESVLEKNPNNRDALMKVINLSIVRGSYSEALNWINSGLKSTPNDVNLLIKKMDILETQRNYAQAAQTAGRILALKPASEIKNKYAGLHTILGREYMGDQLFDMARTEFTSALKAVPAYRLAHEATISSFILQRDNAGAVSAIDRALRFYPQDQNLLLKKADALSATGRNEESARIAGTLMKKNPGDKKLSSGFAEQRLLTGRNFMEAEEYDRAAEQFKLVLQQNPKNTDALSYLINLNSATGNTENALAYADKGLLYYPDNRDFLLKKASLLMDMKRYTEAGSINKKLMDKYPYSKEYRSAYLDGVLASARAYQKKGQADSALFAWQNLLDAKLNDSTALSASAGLLIEQKKYDKALKNVNAGLAAYPGSTDFTRKKMTIQERNNQPEEAAATADSLYKLQPNSVNREYADLLKSKTLKNQFGMYFLNSTFDNPALGTKQTFNIGTIEYRRFFGKGSSLAGRINYAGRAQGTGLQGEAEAYLKHSKKFYSFATAGFSNGLVFPNLRLNYSLFSQLGGGFEAEIGGRYLKTSASPSFSGVVSLAKTLGDFWMNFRVYGISDRPVNDEAKFYQTYNFTARYHLNPQMDFVSFYAGLGTSPDDRSRIIQFPQLVGLLSRNVGAGFQKNIRYRNTLAINGTWYNQKISDETFQNQYDIYLSFLRKF